MSVLLTGASWRADLVVINGIITHITKINPSYPFRRTFIGVIIPFVLVGAHLVHFAGNKLISSTSRTRLTSFA